MTRARELPPDEVPVDETAYAEQHAYWMRRYSDLCQEHMLFPCPRCMFEIVEEIHDL